MERIEVIWKFSWALARQLSLLEHCPPRYTDVAGSKPHRGTYKKLPMNAQLSGKQIYVSLSHSLFTFLSFWKSIENFKKKIYVNVLERFCKIGF